MHLGGRKFCAGAFFTAGLAMLASGLTNAEPLWPQYGFNARHTLFNPSEQILNRSNVAALSLRWEYMTGNGTGIAPLGGAALADGVLYVPSYAQTTFMAFDAETGTSLWIYTGLGTFSDPAVWRGHVYTASLDGNLYAFPTNCVGTCTPTWAVPVGTLGTNSPPTLSNGSIYIGGYDGRAYAFDATTGAERWSAQVNPPHVTDPLNFAPAVSDDQVFVSGDRGVYAFPASCTTPCAPLWVARTQFSPAAAPTVADGFVLVADYQGTVYAFDSATGNSSGEARSQQFRMPSPRRTESLISARETENSWPSPLQAADRQCAAHCGHRRRRVSRYSRRRLRTASSMLARSTLSTRRVTSSRTRQRALTDASRSQRWSWAAQMRRRSPLPVDAYMQPR